MLSCESGLGSREATKMRRIRTRGRGELIQDGRAEYVVAVCEMGRLASVQQRVDTNCLV